MTDSDKDEVKRFIDVFSMANVIAGPEAVAALFGSEKKDKHCKVCGDSAYSNFCSRECVKAYHGTKAQRETIRQTKAAQRTNK